MNFVNTNELTRALNVTPQRVSAITKQVNLEEKDMFIKGRNKHFHPNAVRKILEHKGIDYNKKSVISFCNNKGGTGKTSLAVNTASRLSSMGFKVLMIDADPQGNSTSYLLGDYDYKHVLFDVITGNTAIEDSIINIGDNLALLPSNLENSRLDMQFSVMQINQREYFSKLLAQLDFNYIIWDLSPSISTANFLILLSCTDINIVTTLSDFSVQGLEMTYDVIQQAKNNFHDYRPDVKAVINMFDQRITSSLEHLSNIKKTGIDLFQNVIRVESSMQKSQSSKTTLKQSSNIYKDICSFTDEIIGLSNQSTFVQ